MPPRHLMRLALIAVIVVVTSIAWMALAESIDRRVLASASLDGAVESLWGRRQLQRQPEVVLALAPEPASFTWSPGTVPTDGAGQPILVAAGGPATLADVASSRVRVDIGLDPRRKGVLWYATYHVRYAADHVVVNDRETAAFATVAWPFPAPDGLFDAFRVAVDGADVDELLTSRAGSSAQGVQTTFRLEPGQRATVRLEYSTRGLDEWRYELPRAPRQVRDFELVATTDFGGFDFPVDAMSPTEIERTGEGATLTWRSAHLMGARDVAIEMPRRLNPGPLAVRMARFAPVSLVFFLGALFFMTVLRGLPLHPVHFAFMSASFFAFHLLFAHLVDHVELTLSFAISAAVSMTLVVTYLRKVVSPLFAWREAALLQLLFLVLFARAHFTQGWTGLTVTIGGIVTLFVVMQATAKVDWNLVFPDSREPPPGPLPLP